MHYAKIYFGAMCVDILDRTTVEKLWEAVKEYCRNQYYTIESAAWNGNTLFVYC